MNDNPFASPEDVDVTIVRPRPNGRSLPPPPQPASAITTRPTHAAAAPDLSVPASMGVSTLTAAAAPLLHLLARLRNTVRQPDPGDLHQRAVDALRRFEQKARAAGIPADQLRPAHYALCASLDDVVLNTPWGSSAPWQTNSLVSTFHQEVRAGDRFFDLLAQLRQYPGKYLPVLELMYLCLSLGFMGRYRISPRGLAEIDRLREETYALIMRNRAPAEPELSPCWKGVAAPYKPRHGTVPIWAAAATAVTILAGLFAWSGFRLADASDQLYRKMMYAPPDHMPVIARAAPVQPPAEPAPITPTPLDRLRSFLQPEIEQGLVTVLGAPFTPTIRIANRGMFLSGNASVQPQFTSLLERIGAALRDEPGSALVVGYTDDQPIRTVKFPSNYELSAARAHAARQIISPIIGDPARINAEGRADAEPIAPNTTPDGREQNRRIEIMLRQPS